MNIGVLRVVLHLPRSGSLKAKRKVRYRLADLVAGITPENVHPATDWGSPVGREIGE